MVADAVVAAAERAADVAYAVAVNAIAYAVDGGGDEAAAAAATVAVAAAAAADFVV